MVDFRNLLTVVSLVVLCAVAYVSFWILVTMFVAWVLYQVLEVTK